MDRLASPRGSQKEKHGAAPVCIIQCWKQLAQFIRVQNPLSWRIDDRLFEFKGARHELALAGPFENRGQVGSSPGGSYPRRMGIHGELQLCRFKEGRSSIGCRAIFSDEFIGEVYVKERALAWVPAVMRFGASKEAVAGADESSPPLEDANELTEQAA